MMGKRTPVMAISKVEIKHYRSLSEAAEDNGVSKVDIWRAIRYRRRIHGQYFDYEMEVADGNRKGR